MQANGGLITLDDLANYSVCERDPVRGQYRGYDILSAAPPSSGGTHIVQMLNLLAAFPIGRDGLAFGEPGYVHLLAEALKIAFADRRQHMADPDRVHVPVAELISAAYADQRRAEIDVARARDHAAGRFAEVARFMGGEGSNTTHCTVIDADGTIVSTTQTLQSAFGSKVTTPGTGMLLDNHMSLMDPVPGNPNSIAPGKRILSSMSPTIVLRAGRPFLALGTPGGKRIFGAVAQAVLNVIDHGMTLQEAVEAPRVWTEGAQLELEDGFADVSGLKAALEALGHPVTIVEKVAGGMNGVLVDERRLAARRGLLAGRRRADRDQRRPSPRVHRVRRPALEVGKRAPLSRQETSATLSGSAQDYPGRRGVARDTAACSGER